MSLALIIHSEGRDIFSKNLSVGPFLLMLAGGEKSGNTCDSDTELRWSPPGVVSEPSVPTPAVMRTHGTGWTRRRLGLLLGLSQWKHLNILPTPVGGPATAKCSTGHIYPAHRSEHDGLSLEPWQVEARDGGPH